jgi:glutamine synthetase
MIIIAEYIWIGGNNELRSKSRVLDIPKDDKYDIDIYPKWNFDGSSTNQASGKDSEVIIYPRKVYKSPFSKNSVLIMCDTYTPNDKPLKSNNRFYADKIFNNKIVEKQQPWFGLEQEYFIIDLTSGMPLGFNDKNIINEGQGKFYCSVGAGKALGRKIAQQHLEYCIESGIKISGINAEVAPGQWEFQIGPCEGIDAGDDLWMARYIMERVAEEHGYAINWEPKPLLGNWNGSGCHTNFSTLNMRNFKTNDRYGLDYIMEAVDKLSKNHEEHMKVYGSDNELRMTGLHETASFDKFSSGIANRGASIRIGNDNYKNKCGYFEDRRPSSNCDPYLVSAKLCETILL